MSSVVLSGDTSGTVTLTVPAVAGSNTVTVPAGTGTMAVQGVSTNIVSGTSVASTSGTSIDFTSIPSWVKRITVMMNGVSLSGTADVLVQLGSGSATTTGYALTYGYLFTASSAGVNSAATSISRAASINASTVLTGSATMNLLTNNTWCGTSILGSNSDKIITYSSGSIALSGVLDRVRVTSSNGTDTFDAGSINILYE